MLVQQKLTLLFLCTCLYSVIISVFYWQSPHFSYFKKARPQFDTFTHCLGCERIRMNAGDTKTVSDIEFLIMIPSAPENHAKRQRIRSTWGSATSRFRRRQIFFFIGTTPDKELQKRIFRENTSWKDIIQPDIQDSFKNLTYKSLSMLYWVHYRLVDDRFHPKFILKCDDDNLVDIFRLEDYLETLDLYDDEIVCAVQEEAVPARLEHEQKFIDDTTWSEPLYPKCCLGPAYLIAPEAISGLILAHQESSLPLVPYEDVYITGILTKAANISLIPFPPHIYSHTPYDEKVIMHGALSTLGGFELDVRWELAQREALGDDTYEELQALKEEEEIAKQIRLKEQNLLLQKQGIA